MVFSLHKFIHYLLDSKFVFLCKSYDLVYLVNKPHVSRKIARWLLLFLEYDFIVVYNPNGTHVIINALSRLFGLQNPQVCLIKPHMQIYFI
jgi:hypothetical protein